LLAYVWLPGLEEETCAKTTLEYFISWHPEQQKSNGKYWYVLSAHSEHLEAVFIKRV
jgi:hypothetical protein